MGRTILPLLLLLGVLAAAASWWVWWFVAGGGSGILTLQDLYGYVQRKSHDIANEELVRQNHDDDDEQERQDLLVIGAGYCRTGTASFVKALQRLGLSSYHMKHGVMDTPGHLQLWHDHAVQQLALWEQQPPQDGDGGEDKEDSPYVGPRTLHTASFDPLVDAIAHAGYNATCDVPTSLYFDEWMKRYPNAKVVVTIRGGGGGENSLSRELLMNATSEDKEAAFMARIHSQANAWADSMLTTIGQNSALCQRPPFRWLTFGKHFCQVVALVRKRQGIIRFDPDTQLPLRQDLAQSYVHWNARVWSYLQQQSESQWLVFAPQDGWAPLCDFLSSVDPAVARNCHEVLASGEPYPRVNEGETLKRLYVRLNVMAWVCEWVVIPLLYVMPPLLLTIWIRKLLRRERRRPQDQTKTKVD